MTDRCVAEEAESLLRDMQEYRNLSDRIRAMFGETVTLKDVVDSLEQKVREPEKPDPVNARILTYEESDMWDAYKAIGTPEQCQEAVERTRWIPVSERMPEECIPVNVTWMNRNPELYYSDIKDVPFTATAVYCNDKWHWYSSTCVDYLREYGKCEWDLVDKDISIIAWKPLPEPYHITNPGKKEGEDE